MKGKNEISDEAAVTLVKMYYNYELQYCAKNFLPTELKKIREMWINISKKLNNQFGINIKLEQWKKKLSNIKTNVKTKRALIKRGVTNVKWGLAEKEYDFLYPESKDNNKLECELTKLKELNYIKTDNIKPMNLIEILKTINYSNDSHFNNKEKVLNFKNENNTKDYYENFAQSSKQKFEDTTNLTKINNLPFTTNTNNLSNSLSSTQELNSLFLQFQKQLQSLMCNNNSDSVISSYNNSANDCILNELQIKAFKQQFEAANIQKKAYEQFLLITEKFFASITKFENIIDKLEHSFLFQSILNTSSLSESNNQ